MMLRLFENAPNLNVVEKIVATLKNGGIIIYPTDTIYAIGCDIYQARAVEKICKLKGIDPRKSNLSLICYDLSYISEYAKVNDSVFKLLKRNLPGPFTFILNGSSKLPKIFKNRRTVGIRIPDNNIIRTIVKELGNPILTTSLKDIDSVTEYETDPELIEMKYKKDVDLIINGGYGGNVASTVVDCTGDEITIIRQGEGKIIF